MFFLDNMAPMKITFAVQAINRADFVSAQSILDDILKNPSRGDFAQAVILQFSLLHKQLKAHFIDQETYTRVTLEKVKAIQSKNLGNHDLDDYLEDVGQRLFA